MASKMTLKAIDLDEELPVINEWLYKRGHPAAVDEDFPQIGFIAYKEYPVAVAFLRQCEGIGILEGLSTNPEATAIERHNAIDALIEMVVYSAQKLELRLLISYSRDKSTLERSKNHGFSEVPQTLIVKDLMSKNIRQ